MKQTILICLLMFSGFLGSGGIALASECVSVSKCDNAGNADHSGKQCCESGFPVGSCEASTSNSCVEDCIAEGNSTKECSNECTATSCNMY